MVTVALAAPRRHAGGVHLLVRRLVLLPSIAIALLIPAVAPAGALAARDFPAGWKGFHTYPEMVADIGAVAAAHPDILHLFSIGSRTRAASCGRPRSATTWAPTRTSPRSCSTASTTPTSTWASR